MRVRDRSRAWSHTDRISPSARTPTPGGGAPTSKKLRTCFCGGRVPAPACRGGSSWRDSPPPASHTPTCPVECAKSARPRPTALEPGLQLVTFKDEVMSYPGQRAGLLTAFYKGNRSPNSTFFSYNTNPLREHPSWPHCHPWWTWEDRGPQQIRWFLMQFARPGFCQRPVATATATGFAQIPGQTAT